MAKGLNKVELIGRLGADPEMRFTPSGKAVTSCNIAVDRSWKGADGEKVEKTDWFKLEAWSGLAEVMNQYLKKGSLVYVEGRIQIDRVEGDPVKYFTKIVVNNMIMLSGRDVDPNAEPAEEGDIDFP